MTVERTIRIAAEAGIRIRSLPDISYALGLCIGTPGIIFTEADLSQEFFDLRSGLAGELFQKFVNYKVRVAIVMPNPEAYGERFSELAYEHSTHPLIRFVRTIEDAKKWLQVSNQVHHQPVDSK